MPHGFEDIDDANDIFHEPEPEVENEATKQLNGELEDKAADEEPEQQAPDASKDTGDGLEEDVKGGAKGEDDDSEDDDESEAGGEYTVEAIRDHKFYKGEVLYLIKWQGYGEKENTWEPEDHLLPHSRAILAAYHQKIGGPPVPPVRRTKSKQKLREQPSSEDLPTSKRRKRNDDTSASPAEETAGTWLPNKEDWENLVVKVETLERDEAGQLLAYIKFKNGKRSKVGMDMVYRHCPRPMLKFYEDHLKFK